MLFNMKTSSIPAAKALAATPNALVLAAK